MNKYDSTWGGNFENLKTLGSGAAATVYKARHSQTGHIRAIRYINTHITPENPKKTESIMEEVKLLLRLGNGHNPHVIRAFGFTVIANQPVIELEYIRGEDLDDLLVLDKNKNRNDPGATRCLPIEEVIRLVKDMSSALSYIHHDLPAYCRDPDEDSQLTDQQIIKKYCTIHNDIHTKNIMRRDTGEYVLLDFGLSLEGSEVKPRSSRGGKGVPEFMAPEKFDSEALTTEADIYGLGVVFFECLTGRVPYPEKTNNPVTKDLSMQARHAKLPLPDLWELRQSKLKAMGLPHAHSDIPGWLDQLIQKCLAKNAKDRFLDGFALRTEVLRQSKAEEERILTKQIEQALAEESARSAKEITSLQKQWRTEVEQEKKALAEERTRNQKETDLLRQRLKEAQKGEVDPVKIQSLQAEINRLEEEVYIQKQRSTALNEGLKMKERAIELEQQKRQAAELAEKATHARLAVLKSEKERLSEQNQKLTQQVKDKEYSIKEKDKIIIQHSQSLSSQLATLGLPEDPKRYIKQLKHQTWRLGLVMTLVGGAVGWAGHSSQIPSDWKSYYPYDSTAVVMEADSTMAVDTIAVWDEEPTRVAVQPRYSEAEAEKLFLGYEQRLLDGYALDNGSLQALCQEYPIYKDKILAMYRERIKALTPIDPPGAATLQARLNELTSLL